MSLTHRAVYSFLLERLDEASEDLEVIVEGRKLWQAAFKAKENAALTFPGSEWRVKRWMRTNGKKNMP